MSDSTRRGFLAFAGAGVAAGAAAIAIPSAAGATAPSEDTSLPNDAAPSMVVHVEDVAQGKATLMVDGEQIAITDKALAAKIARAYKAAQQH